jgi:hypothetical protein
MGKGKGERRKGEDDGVSVRVMGETGDCVWNEVLMWSVDACLRGQGIELKNLKTLDLGMSSK